MERCRIHDAQTIVFVTLCAALCGYSSWDEIAEYSRCRKNLMEEYLGPLSSMPSHDTISRFFSLLKPTDFEGEYRKWVEMVFLRRSNPSARKDVLAFDGKEITSARESDDTPLESSVPSRPNTAYPWARRPSVARAMKFQPYRNSCGR